MNETSVVDLAVRRQAIRRQALANFILVLLTEAQRTSGRFAVRPLAPDAVLLEYRDVRTLIRRGGVFGFARRDFAVLLACPAQWPFDRGAVFQPFVLAPQDFAHSNSDGKAFCLDLMGVLPERLPALLYDNLRLDAYRLDHCVDPAAADFMRARLTELPADPRPLYPAEASLHTASAAEDTP